MTRRLMLLTLIEFSREALTEKLITIDHALLLAKLAPAEQEMALRFTLEKLAAKARKTEDMLAHAKERRADGRQSYGGYWEPQSVLDLKRFIEDEIKLELARARRGTWQTRGLVLGAGTCVGCAKNTAANSALFGDLKITDARCTDSACFAAKRAEFVQRQVEAVKAAGEDAVRVSWKATTSKPRSLEDAAKYLAQVFKRGQWIEAKLSGELLRRAVQKALGEWQPEQFDEALPGVEDALASARSVSSRRACIGSARRWRGGSTCRRSVCGNGNRRRFMR